MAFVYLMPNHHRRFNQLCLFLFITFLILSGIPAPAAEAATVVSVSGSYNTKTDRQYKKASDYYYRLERDPSIGNARNNWLKGVRDFQRIYRIAPKSKIAPACLYMVGRMYRRMYQHFKLPTDIDQAIGYYTDVVSFFPESDKADDALYNIAQIQAADKNNPHQAVKSFQKLIDRYPDSSLKTQSEKQLLEIAAEHKLPHSVSSASASVIKKSHPKPAAARPIITDTGEEKAQTATDATHLSDRKTKTKKEQKSIELPVQKAKQQDPAPPVKDTAASKDQKVEKDDAPVLVRVRVRVPAPIDSKKELNNKDIKIDPAASTPAPLVKVVTKKPDKLQPVAPKKQLPVKKVSTDKKKQTPKLVPAKNSAVANVMPVKYWSSDNYSRVVIRASAPIKYKSKLLDKVGNKPRRLYIDFTPSYIPTKYRTPVPIEDGLLKQIRTGQFKDKTVRIVLDIESISDYKIFSLNDPFRVVVDVRGVKKTRAATAPMEKKHPPRIQTVVTEGTSKDPIIILSDRKKVKPPARQSNPAMGSQAYDSEPLTLAQQLGLGVRRIVIDPGHGGKDPGAMAFGLKEKDIVIKVAHHLKKILKNKYKYEVLLTRTGDTYLPLEERTAIANTKSADLFVSIHVNAHPKKSAKGVETFYLNLATNKEAMRVAARENATSTHNINELQDILSDLMQNAKINESSKLAQYVQTSMVSGLKDKKYKVKNLGVKQAPFYVLIGAEMPAVLAEISFITNPKESKLLKQDAYLKAIAEQIAIGVSTYVEQRRTAALKL